MTLLSSLMLQKGPTNRPADHFTFYISTFSILGWLHSILKPKNKRTTVVQGSVRRSPISRKDTRLLTPTQLESTSGSFRFLVVA